VLTYIEREAQPDHELMLAYRVAMDENKYENI
jgi:hypothetical protein